MVHRLSESLVDLYEADETAWLEQTAELVRRGLWQEVDADHLAEFLTDMAKRDRREVKSRLTVLLAHLLKLAFQPAGRSPSWLATIQEQQRELYDLLESGVLSNHAADVFAAAYAAAVKQAATETGLARGAFPTECPWTPETMLADVDPAG